MIYRSKVDTMAPTVLITLTACFIAMGLIILIGTGSAMGWFILILCPPILPLIVMLVAWPMTYDTGCDPFRRRADPAGPRRTVASLRDPDRRDQGGPADEKRGQLHVLGRTTGSRSSPAR